jgi:ribose transport system ATP-binding protein
MNMQPNLLRMTGISKRFAATHALRDVSLEVQSGRVLALIGENGAGKSTLTKILSGVYQPDSGTMEIAGRPFRPENPQAARYAGVAIVYQELTLAPHLSVEDNVMLGQEVRRFGCLLRSKQRQRVRRALELLGHPELAPEAPVHRLSVGARQLVEIARALVLDAKLIVFDEPTSSLTQHDSERLFEVIRRLKSSGIGIVYISHFLEEVRQVSDHFTVLRDGRSVGGGDLQGAREANIIALMAGRSVEELFPRVQHVVGGPLMSVERLSGVKLPQKVSLEVHRGEILGIAGLVGAGRTELLRCLFGLDATSTGAVRIAGTICRQSPAAMIAAGAGLVSEDRKGEGLAQSQSIADNLTASRLAPYSRWGLLNLRRRRRAVHDWMVRLQIKAASPEQTLTELSGGNQQKVALARILHQDADVLLLDEPTRGIDVGTKAEIYRMIGEAAAAGKAIVFVSSYFTELLAVCDRVAVMARGRLREIRPVAQWNEHSLLRAACELEGVEA